MFRFASPWFLVLLAVLAGLLWWNRRRPAEPALRVSGFRPGEAPPRSLWVRAAPAAPWIKTAALGLMVLALAGPQKGTREMRVPSEGINIMLAVDVSESMAAMDFERGGEPVDRLEAVKSVVRDFIQGRYGDRIGLVVFGSVAHTGAPLTMDYNAIGFVLDRLKIGSAGPQTAIGDAIGISLKRLGEVPGRSRVIILLTDGRSNTGVLSPDVAAGIAGRSGVKVYTVGVGGREPAPFVERGAFGGRRVVYRRVDIDEVTLKAVAASTGGLYFRAEDTEGLQKVYETIDRMEKHEVEIKTFAEYRDLYPYFLGPAFGLLFLWAVLINTRLMRVP